MAKCHSNATLTSRVMSNDLRDNSMAKASSENAVYGQQQLSASQRQVSFQNASRFGGCRPTVNLIPFSVSRRKSCGPFRLRWRKSRWLQCMRISTIMHRCWQKWWSDCICKQFHRKRKARAPQCYGVHFNSTIRIRGSLSYTKQILSIQFSQTCRSFRILGNSRKNCRRNLFGRKEATRSDEKCCNKIDRLHRSGRVCDAKRASQRSHIINGTTFIEQQPIGEYQCRS